MSIRLASAAIIASAVTLVLPATAETATPQAIGDVEIVATTELAAGVVHQEFTTTGAAGDVIGDVLAIDLTTAGVSLDLINSGAVASAASVSSMADDADAIAGVNGDFFNIGQTNAPVGPAIQDDVDLKAAVPDRQRHGPSLPAGTSNRDIFGVRADGTARVGHLQVAGTARSADTTIPIKGLNQYALFEGTVGVFDSNWGTVSRARAVCGTDDDRNGPCSENVREVTITDGVVASVSTQPGDGAMAPDSVVLLGRDEGADALGSLEQGETVDVDYRLKAAGKRNYVFAVGGLPLMDNGTAYPDLDDTASEPRTAAGASADGRTVWLLTVDGRSDVSNGLTLKEMAQLLQHFGAADAVNLDGGGSSTLVAQQPGDSEVTVENAPSEGTERSVPNGVGVFISE